VFVGLDSGVLKKLKLETSKLAVEGEKETVVDLQTESITAVSVDKISQIEQGVVFLSIGSNTQVKVFKIDSATGTPIPTFSLSETSDNVSSVKTLYNSATKKPLSLFATYNGRLSFVEHAN